MKNTIFNTTRAILVVLAIYSLNSCSQDSDLNNLSDTIYVRNNGSDMPAYIFGNGSEKVFLITLNGGPGGVGLEFRSTMFKEQIETECAVVYFDQRHSGMSQGNLNDGDVTVDTMAEDVLAFVKVIKKKYGEDARFFLMGHSWGGTLGTATLLKDQSDFLGWIEIDGAHNPAGIYFEYPITFDRTADEQIALGNNIDYWTSVKDLILRVDTETYNDEDFLDLNSEAFDAESTLNDDGFINEQTNDPDSAIIFDYNIFTALWNSGAIGNIFLENGLFRDVDYTNRLQEITVPSLFLWGKYDMVVPLKFGQEGFDNIGSTSKKLVIFEHSGHSPLATEPDLFAMEVIDFVNTHK